MAAPPGAKGEKQGRRNHELWSQDMFAFLAGLTERYGDIAAFDLGRSPCVLVNGATAVRELLVEREACLRKPEFVKASNRGHWGDGLTTLEGPTWRARRHLLRPSFRARHLSARLAIVAQCANELFDAWTPVTDVDVLRHMRILTARIAVRVVLDAEMEGFGPAAGRAGVLPFEEAYGEDYAGAPTGDARAPLFMVRPRAPRTMNETVRIIDERIATGEQRGDVLSDLVHARLPNGERLRRDEIVGEVIQMLYAGHLTIPSSLVNFWRDIAAHGVAAGIVAEARRLCATGVPGPDVLSTTYCFAALKESLRLHPAAPLLYREVEIAFELGGFELARDVAVWVSPRLLHVDPRYFPDPRRFAPERFAGGRAAPASMYLPFGAGPRACIASQLALHQMALVSLLAARRFASIGIPAARINTA